MKYVSMYYYCYLHKLFIAYGAKLEKNTCVLCGYLFYNQRIVSTLHSMNEDLEDILLLVTGYCYMHKNSHFTNHTFRWTQKTHKLSLSPLFKSLNSEYIFILDGTLKTLNESQHMT